MPRLNIGVAGIPGAWSSEALVSALHDQGVDSRLISLFECTHDLASGTVTWAGHDLSALDGLIVKKMGDLDNQYTENRIVMLRQLENDGVIVASRAGAIDAAVNRYRNTWLLRLANIPMPKTALTESRSSANAIVREWGKVVLKPLFTTKARGMRLLSRDDSDSDIDAALSQFEQEGRGPFYLQEFVESRGRDVAVTIMDGKVLGAFYRVAKPGNWKTTTQAGGHYEPCELGDDAAELALRAAKPFSLDFTSVDLVETEAGWLVYEVSAFGGFSGLKKAYGIDAAALYAKHIVEKVSNERN